ncbi:MAG: DUF3604 domain-containing protein [Acidimicrobiales bacterium]
MRRREFVLGSAAAGALLVATPASAFARAFLRTMAGGATSRQSRLFPGDGTMVAHADLHNHTLLSDGAGRVEEAFGMLRSAGMDVASLTDHTVFGSVVQDSLCDACSPLAGMDEAGWHTHRRVADAANAPGEFVAIRGFEWTTAHLGHINVWFSEQWIDSLTTGSLVGVEALVKVLGDADESLHDLLRQLDPVVRAVPELTSIDGFYDWLSRPVAGSGFGGGGADALCGFNHPNESGNFDQFAFFGHVADRVVSCELLNRYDDYLFRGTGRGEASPLNACLNAGWRVGMLGVTDEHGNQFDVTEGKGRAGLWVHALTRDGVREALEARRFYATRLAGLRLDASAEGVRMGGSLGHGAGPVRVELDIDKGPEWYGKRLLAQVLTAGPTGGMPHVAAVHEFLVPGPSQPVVAFDVELSADDTTWAVLRVTDPELPAHELATGEYASFGDVVAYASPWWLQPESQVS